MPTDLSGLLATRPHLSWERGVTAETSNATRDFDGDLTNMGRGENSLNTNKGIKRAAEEALHFSGHFKSSEVDRRRRPGLVTDEINQCAALLRNFSNFRCLIASGALHAAEVIATRGADLRTDRPR
jgi:hypothetical protein